MADPKFVDLLIDLYRPMVLPAVLGGYRMLSFGEPAPYLVLGQAVPAFVVGIVLGTTTDPNLRLN